jgi:flagellar protein FliS
MFSPHRTHASAYRSVDVETGITNATPHQLVTMLFDGALAAIATARGALARSDQSTKGAQIGKAVRIVEEGLHGGLDRNAGGELASHLASVYTYVVQRLTHANLRNDEAALLESQTLLATLRDGWVKMPATQNAA